MNTCANCNHLRAYFCMARHGDPVPGDWHTYTCDDWTEWIEKYHKMKEFSVEGCADAVNIGTSAEPCYVMGIRIPICRW